VGVFSCFLHVVDMSVVWNKKIAHLNTGVLSQMIMLLFLAKSMQKENNVCCVAEKCFHH